MRCARSARREALPATVTTEGAQGWDSERQELCKINLGQNKTFPFDLNQSKYFILIFLKGGNKRRKTVKKKSPTSYHHCNRVCKTSWKILCTGWWLQLWTSLESDFFYCLKISVWATAFCWRQTRLTEESNWTSNGLALRAHGVWVQRTPPP